MEELARVVWELEWKDRLSLFRVALYQVDSRHAHARLDLGEVNPVDVDHLVRRAEIGRPDLAAEVRFSPKVAKIVRERFGATEVRELKGGTLSVRLSTSSAAWLARWVLPFGVEAEIVAPREQREALGRLCREAAEVYRRPG